MRYSRPRDAIRAAVLSQFGEFGLHNAWIRKAIAGHSDSRSSATLDELIETRKIEEHDHRRIANRRVVPCKPEAAVFAVDLKDGDIVAALIAAVEEFSLRIKAEAARIVASRPLFADVLEISVIANGEDSDAVVQTVAGVDKPPISGNEDFGAEVAAREVWRQR